MILFFSLFLKKIFKWLGKETPEFIDSINAPCIKVLHVDISKASSSDIENDHILTTLSSYAISYSQKAVALLLDSKNGASAGGTGVAFDWNIISKLNLPVI